MRSAEFREALWVLLFLIAATWLIASTGIDIGFSSGFFTGGGWPVGEQPLMRLLYRIDRIPAILLGICAMLLAITGIYKPAYSSWKSKAVFLVVLLMLGPGLLVNSVFKQHWGRPRPREVTEFGGSKPFLQPWQKGISGNGRSFPSGHASAAFYMAAPYFIYRRTDRRRALAWLSGGILFGLLMSFARITQGAHFLSDCLWAWGMVHLTALLLSRILLANDSQASRADI